LFKRFFLKIGILTSLAAMIIYVLQSQTALLHGFDDFVWYSLFFLAVLTLVSFSLLLRGLAMKGNEYFMQYFGAMFGLKIFSALIFVCFFIYIQPIANKKFVLPFFVLYFLFTGLLVVEARNILTKPKN
jgi:hypothetical protein